MVDWNRFFIIENWRFLFYFTTSYIKCPDMCYNNTPSNKSENIGGNEINQIALIPYNKYGKCIIYGYWRTATKDIMCLFTYILTLDCCWIDWLKLVVTSG